ncbi:MAG: polysaccharide biosynthesis tyrosine autokinase [Bacteroidetes bacterium]|nr:polysaccharide biosynthesis tyrosine autokinase [Bacteroidota bacterium]
MESSFSNKGKGDSEGGILNLRWVITTMLATWPWFLVSIIVAVVCANIYLRYATPVYKISSEVLLNDSRTGAKGDEQILEGLGLTQRNGNEIGNLIRIMKSKPLMAKVVTRLKLNLQYFEYGNVKTTQFYGQTPFKVLMPDSLLNNIQDKYSYKIVFGPNDTYTINASEKNNWKGKLGYPIELPLGKVTIIRTGELPLKEGVKYSFSVSPAMNIAGGYAAKLDIVRPDKMSSYINISIKDDIPERGINIVDTLVRVYAEKNIDDRNEIATKTLEFINERLKDVNKALTTVESGFAKFKETNKITADVKDQSQALLENTTTTQKELTDKEVQLQVIQELEKYLTDSKNKQKTVPSGLLVDDGGAIGKIIDKYNMLQSERYKMLTYSTEANPNVKTVDKQLESLRTDMQLSLEATKRSLQVVINELRRRSGSIDAEIRDVPRTEMKFLEFSRQQHIREELFLYLLKKSEETQVAKSATVSNVTVINNAENTGAVQPNVSRVKNTAILLGLLIPMLGFLARRMLNTRIIAKSDIISNSNIPILGDIGHNDSEVAVAVKSNSHSVLSEQFRALRTNVQFMLPDKSDKVVMLTSSMSGEGKSFIAINLASTFAISGKRVVLMELDLRKPKISKHLGLNNEIGLSTYAVGQAEMSDIIQPSGVEDNLFVIPSGPIPPNPAELIMLPRVDELFDHLKQNFDYIFIDTAPVGLVTDALLLNRFASTTLYVIRQGYTFKQQLQIANEIEENGKMQRLSFLINDVVHKRGFAYGYGYGYESGYGYGYGYGYGGYGYGKYSGGYFDEKEEKPRGFKKIITSILSWLPGKR